MELGKHEGEPSTRDTWWKEKLKAPSESEFLRFTFRPSFGRLPTPFHIADAKTISGRAANEPVDKNYQEIITRNQIEVFSAGQTLGSGPRGNLKVTGCTNSSPKHFRSKEYNSSKGKMDKNDLFKAEFVFITDLDEDKTTTADNWYEHGRSKVLDPSCVPTSDDLRRQLNAPQLSHTELPHSPVSQQKQSQPHKIKTSYKAFAAIPTNTLLLEQKALDEPNKTEGAVDTDFSTRSEMCSPAQLRQQTEELCAAIDQVLQDPLPMRRCDSSPSSLQSILDSDISKTSVASQRPTGRETRFANLLSGSTVIEKQKTKPGVIRPTTVKKKVILKEEEPIQPNPFKKYLEETSDSETEQDSSHFHPFIHTKMNLSTKSPLHPQSISHPDSLSPGPFSHLGSILGDIHDHSYSPYRRNALYNKPPHPIVPIPENEALSSQEFRSAREQNEVDPPPSSENQDLSKRGFPDHASAHSRAHYVLRGDVAHALEKRS